MRLRFPLSAALLFLLLPPLAQAGPLDDLIAQHRARLGVTAWHQAGWRGQGVKVAVLDGDFVGYQAQLGRTLPPRVRVRSFRDDGSIEGARTAHGLRTAQILHALAPEAELLLVNWQPGRPDRFLAAVRWAREQKAAVISCSVTATTWGDGAGGGPHHAELAKILGTGDRPGDPLFFCAAGNMARGHWGGQFQGDASGLHQWRPGQVDDPIETEVGRTVRVSLLHAPGAIYELLLFEGDSTTPTARLRSQPGPLPSATLSFTPPTDGPHRLRIRLVSGKGGAFHCIARPGRLSIGTVENSVCCFPADNPQVVTVGAIDRLGSRPGYSACGPAALRKPDLVAPAPFPCPDRPAGFHGTSAAAPQAAALAVLLRQSQPKATARQLREILFAGLKTDRGKGFTVEAGFGRLRLGQPKARQAAPLSK